MVEDPTLEPVNDGDLVLETLQSRARALGFDSVGEALDYVEDVKRGEL